MGSAEQSTSYDQFVPQLESTVNDLAIGEGADDELSEVDRTTATSSEEILTHLFSIFEEIPPNLKEEKFASRYWLAVILSRTEFDNERQTMDKFGIPRTTSSYHLGKNPMQCNYAAPTRKKYTPTTADDIVEYLCKPENEPVINEDSYSLRFWLAIANLGILKAKERGFRTNREKAEKLGMNIARISRGKNNGLTPASQGFLPAQ